MGVNSIVRSVVRDVGVSTVGRNSFSWAAYWAAQSEVLFFGEVSKISAGKLYNQKSGSSDWITVAGAAGSYTFQCPNTAPYKSADTDYIWFKTDTTQRTTTEAELIGYDLQHTPVKYDDASPNTLRWIMILSSSISAAKRDNLFKSFYLMPFWDNDLNAYGHIKSNRATQNLWTPESVYVLHDTFTGANNTLLTAHTMDLGAGWTEKNGVNTHKIVSNKAIVGTGGLVITTAEAGIADVDISLDITIPVSNSFVGGVTFRYYNNTNFWEANIQRSGGGTPYVRLRLNETTNIGTANVTATAGNTYTLRLVASGDSIKVYWVGDLMIDVTNATHNNRTLVGLFSYVDGNYIAMSYDNFIAL